MEEESEIDAGLGGNLQGHGTAEQMFLDAFNAGRLHHAWLITGPRGIGKAALAYKMARFLMHNAPEDAATPGLFGDVLEKAPADALTTDPLSPVNKVITAGGHGDIVVIERTPDEKTGKVKAEIGVNNVRVLQNFFAKTSTEGGWRVAIVDSACEMNRNAANALLKSLEEPPKNAVLFLLAHAPGKLLPTITSRCRQMRLNPLSHQAVTEILQRQHPDLSMDEVQGYATLSDGSPGYALKLVDHQGLELYIQILENLASMPRLNVPLAHKLADSLSAKKDEQKYVLFGELLANFISRLTRHVAHLEQGSEGAQSPVQPVLTGELDLMAEMGQRISLDQWVDLWEKVSHKMGLINLDRKQVVLNILTLLNQSLK